MLLLLVRFRLLAYLSAFALEILGVYIQHIRSFLWSAILLFCLAIGLAHTFFTTMNNVKLEQISAVTLPTKIPHQSVSFTRSQLERRLTAYHILLEIQPNHRDILINVSLLEKSLRNPKDAYLTWEAARQLDPNSEVFTIQE